MSISENRRERADLERGILEDGYAANDSDTQVIDIDDPNFNPTISMVQEESPYAEVRSAVANTDDPMMPVSTLRAWVVGLIWAILLSGVNQFFAFRNPSVPILANVTMLLTLPICKAWARYFPNISICGLPLNLGPFNIKEHVIISVMADIGGQPAYSTKIIAVQKIFYNQHPTFAYQWLLVMSTQLIGFSMAGICRRFLVMPPSMIWPENLMAAAIFNTLHSKETTGSQGHGGISRQRIFTYVLIGSIFYTFVPSYLFTALSSFSWVCWIAPKSVKINQMFGVTHGLAMGLLTFDWGQIAYNGSPLAYPWWVAANTGFCVVFFYWFLLPILYYKNIWYSAYLPLVSSGSFDNAGNPYNVSRIVNKDGSFNLQAYQAYSPLFISASFAILHGLCFASTTATVTHVLLYYHKHIRTYARRPLSVQPDIHARLMSEYKEVPDWWYLVLFLSMFAFGVVVIEVWDTRLPVWAFVLALMISSVFFVPIGVIEATTTRRIALNLVTELIIGYALPGRPIAMMMFKTWGYIPMARGLDFTCNLKIGHYMKIPPRSMFFCQVVAMVVAGTVQLGVQEWMFSNIEDLCSHDQKDGFTCPQVFVFGTASIMWGVIGPQRVFSLGQLYYGVSFFFLVGTLAPLFQWIIHMRFNIRSLKYLHFPVIFSSVLNLPPATPISYVPMVLVCYTFNYRIRRYHFHWWSKYNYILAAGLDAGYAIGVVVIFFALQYPKNGTIGLKSIQSWWGNVVYTKTADFAGVAYKTIPDGKTFGPSSW